MDAQMQQARVLPAALLYGEPGFRYATDRLGRKRLFSLTPILYLSGKAAAAFS